MAFQRGDREAQFRRATLSEFSKIQFYNIFSDVSVRWTRSMGELLWRRSN